MFRPLISARMEQPGDFTRDWINAGEVGPFVTVAVDATQGEVFVVGWAAVFLGDDVINLKVEASESLWEMAILTAEPRSRPNQFHELPLHSNSRGRVLSF